jgi:uncharacterized RDD family membrane protein YckC
MLYDGFLLFGLGFFAAALWLLFHHGRAPGPGDPAFQAYLLALCLAFVGGFWTHGGQTLGMRAWKIRLTNTDGGPVSWRQALIRFFASWISLGLFGLGYWRAWWDPERRCWHDLASGTRVIWQRRNVGDLGPAQKPG